MHTSDTCTVEPAARLAVLKERKKTIQAEYKTDTARLAEDNAKRDADAAKRETRLIATTAGLLVFAVAVLGLLIRRPG